MSNLPKIDARVLYDLRRSFWQQKARDAQDLAALVEAERNQAVNQWLKKFDETRLTAVRD